MPIQGQLPAGAFLGQHRLQPEPRGEDRQVEVLHETPVPAPPPANPTGQVPFGGGENWHGTLAVTGPVGDGGA